MDTNLGDILWQFAVVALIILAATIGVWAGRRYRRRLGQGAGESPKWATAAAWALGLGVFVVLAVVFGFVLDLTAGP